MPAWENGPSWLITRLTSGATSPRSESTGVISSDSPPMRRIVGLSSRRNVGRRSMSAPRSVRRSAVACATLLECSMKELTCLRSRASGASVVSESRARSESTRFCDASSARTLSTSLSAGVGAADDLVELRAAAGEAGAELGDDQRQPLPVGQAHHVVDQVEVDRLRGVRDRQQVLALARALVDLLQRRRRGGVDGALLGRLALDEPLADQRLRAHLAARVGAEVLVAGVLDVEHDDGLEVARDVERVDLADLDARDLDVLAGDHEAGVVEDRADLVGAAVAGARGQHRGGGHGEQDGDGGDALHVTAPGARGSGRSRRDRGCRGRWTAPIRPRRAGWRRPGSAWRRWSAGPRTCR